MSPEQAQGKTKEIDHRADIFSFGCILFEAITGQRPFTGKDHIEVLNKVIREPAPLVTTLNPDVPPDLQRIVRRCLAKNPDERYHNIKDVALLTGRLMQRGDSMLISAELIDSRDNKQLWGEQYERHLTDLAVQSEIAREITNNLRPTLSGVE
jgi:serine/threonine protein kinase